MGNRRDICRPNIIQILADDMGYGDFGVFSEGRTSTPALDQLTEEGICLTQHYSAAPVCTPARASLLTGRYPHRTGAIDMRELRGLCNLALRETSIAEMLQQADYKTGLIGKWHNGSLGKRFHPNARGFDEFIGFRSGWQDYYRWILDRNGTYERSDGRYLTDVFTDEAIGFLQRHRDEPFFLHLAYNAPHSPLQAPEADIRPFRDTGKFEEDTVIVYGMIAAMDRGIGKILEEVRRLRLEENTLVMFTSDNGPANRRFNCGFAGKKGNVYEGGIRVPMILRWPAGLGGDVRRHDGMVHFCDWFPTLLSACKVQLRPELRLDGVDQLPVLRGGEGEAPAVRYWQWNRYQPEIVTDAAMRDGDWKLVRPVLEDSMWTDPKEMEQDNALRNEPWKHFEPVRGAFPPRELPPLPPPQLFNLAHDPFEREDLATQSPGRVEQMLAQLEDWFSEVESERAAIEVWPEALD